MLNRNLFSLTLMLLLGVLLLGADCGGVTGDDDDSAGDDDDSSVGDDDDSAVGDDDDSATTEPLPLNLTNLDIYCESDPDLARDRAGDFAVTVEFEGYAEDVVFFIWDAYTSGGGHFQDEAQPFWLSNLDYSLEDGQWDIWGLGGGGDDADGNAVPDLGIWSTIADANANNGTILDCYDANSNPNVELHNYMVCGVDYYDKNTKQCYFCGEDLGEDVFWMGSLADNTAYQVGLFTDPNTDEVWQVTTDVTSDAGACTFDSATIDL